MNSVLFSVLAASSIFLAGFVSFSNSTYFLLRKDMLRQANRSASEACMAYGDLLVRTGQAGRPVNGFRTHIYVPGCLTAEGGVCTYRVSCTIAITNDNKITVSII